MRLKLCAYVVNHRLVFCITTSKAWWVDDRLFALGRKLRMNMMSRFFPQFLQPTGSKTVTAKRRVLVGFALILSALTACSLIEERDYPLSDHYDGSHFYNRDAEGNNWPAVFKFLFTSLWEKTDWPKARANPAAEPIPARVTQGLRATYINHATVLIQVDGLNILTDPIWSDRASPVSFAGPKRIRGPGVAIEDLPEIDLIVVSHNHYDHMDTASLRTLRERQSREPVIISGLGNADLLRSLGYDNAIELDWDESTDVGSSKVHFVECQHQSARGLHDRMRTLWGSFVIETSQGAIYFAGDTGYSPHFAEQGARYGPFALSIIPIGAYEPRYFMKAMHLNPSEAVAAHKDLKSEQSLGIHFGVFQLTWEGIDQPVIDLGAALIDQAIDPSTFWVLEPGQFRVLPPLNISDN